MCVFILKVLLLCGIVLGSRGDTAPCLPELAIDITDGTKLHDIIIQEGVSFTPVDYYTVDDRIFGCICNVKTCIRKCCPVDKAVQNKTCVDSSYNFRPELKKYITPEANISSFHIIHGMIQCTEKNRFLINPTSEEFTITTDGQLNWQDENYDQLNYCVEYFADSQSFTALACADPMEEVVFVHSIGMIISMPFLLVTFLVYAILPERNLPAKALMCYVLSLLFAYVMLVTIQLANLDPTACTVIAYLCYFFFMVSFFWMNSSCIDIWLTFSGIKGMTGQRTQERKRFMYYSMYSWGLPLIMVCILIWANQSEVLPQSLQPLIGQGQCWFGNQLSTGVYFYFPIAFLVGSNIVLFAITAIKIIRVQRDTKMLNAKDSTKHENDKQRDDVCSDQIYLTNRVENRGFEVYDFLDEDNSCFRFNLYVKLLFAMGVNWSMEIISWAVKWQIPTSGGWIWYLTDFCNAMYGVLIFFIFVFKKNIWVVMKKRYLQFTGKPQQAHRYGLSSTHRTTITQSLQSIPSALLVQLKPIRKTSSQQRA